MFFPYKDTASRIHLLDARSKIVFVLAVFIFSILLSDILYLSVLFVLVLVISISAHTLKSTWSLLRYALYVAIFVVIFNVLLSSGRDVLFMFGPIAITSESILFSISMCLRLFLAVSAFAILTFAIHPDEALRTMSKVGYKTTTALSLSTRMYPTIANDSRNIMDSMRARGVEFDRGGFLKKVKARANVVMPLLFNSLDRSIAIAEAMETRGFGAGKRTNYSESRLNRRQKMMITSFVLSIIFGISLFVLGYGNADYLNGAGFHYVIDDFLVLAAYVILLSPILAGGGK